MAYPSFPNLGPAWPEVCYARFISCFLSSGRVVIMAYSSVFCGKRSTNGREAVNKRDGGVPEEQQPFAGIGVGHIGKLVGADTELFG